MTACDRYKPFVRTSSGLGPENPTGTGLQALPTSSDYSEWLNTADRFITLVEDNVDVLQNEVGATEWPATATYLRTSYDDLGNRYTTWPTSTIITQTANLAVQAACKLGELEDEMLRVGATPQIPFRGQTPPPPPPPGVLDEMGKGASNVLALVALGFLVWQWSQSK